MTIFSVEQQMYFLKKPAIQSKLSYMKKRKLFYYGRVFLSPVLMLFKHPVCWMLNHKKHSPSINPLIFF